MTRRPPLTIFGRSPFDPIRLRWAGLGDILLGFVCALGVRGVGGVLFGIVFMILGVATWVATRFGGTSWYALSKNAKIVAGTGSIIGCAFLYLCFFYLFIFFWFLRFILSELSRS